MPKIFVGDKGDCYWIDDWKYLYTYQYKETRQQYESLSGSGLTIYERMNVKIKGQIPDDYWVLECEDVDYGNEFVTIKRFWAHKNHYRFVPYETQNK